MSTALLTYVLTALAVLVVVLTPVRVRREAAEGGPRIGGPLVRAHTVAGTLALVAWTAFLVFPEDTPPGSPVTGIVALALWWVVAVLGLLVLLRWLPLRGRHASARPARSWAAGAGLSVLGHVGGLCGVLFFTYAYLVAAV